MKKILFPAALAALCTAAVAYAADAPKSGAAAPAAAPAAAAAAPAPMEPPKPGDEVKALKPLFNGTGTWTGKVPAGAMGPQQTADMTTHGKAVCKEMLGGFWYACDVTDTMGTGKTAMTWMGHMMTGWDAQSKSYVSYTVDNMGMGAVFTGTMDAANKKFTLESQQPMMMMGQMMKDRLTWDWSDAKGMVKFTDEHQMAGSTTWTTFETAEMKMTGAAGTKKAGT